MFVPVLCVIVDVAADLFVHLPSDLLDFVDPEQEPRPARPQSESHRRAQSAVRVQLGEVLKGKLGSVAIIL